MGLLQEFKEFALKGSVVDLAVGVIIGGAFGKIVSSLVNDIMMPPLGLLMGGVDFSKKIITLREGQNWDQVKQAWGTPPTVISYGVFINNIIDFTIVAFSIFIIIKLMNSAKRKPAPVTAESTTKECPYCATTISIKAKKCPACTADL